MHVLCTVWSVPSHLQPLLPLVRELCAGGDEVTVATTPGLAPSLAGSGARVEPILSDPTGAPPPPGDAPGLGSPFADALHAMLDGCALADQAKAVAALAGECGAQIVVRDDSEFAGYLAGELLGLPVACVAGAMSNAFDHDAMTTVLNVHRARVGLPAVAGPSGLYPGPVLDHVPAALSFAADHGPRTTLRFRQPRRPEPGARLPEWVADGPGGRPLVYAAIGTGWRTWREQGVDGGDDPYRAMETLLDALSRVDCAAVVSSGGMDVAAMSRGPHVEVRDHVPQQLVLEASRLFCTHGGYNGIREAIRAGVPMLVRPGSLDQPANAAAVERHGLGSTITGLDADGLAQRIHDTLGDDELADRMRTARRRMLALPGVDTAPGELRRLVGEEGPPDA